VDFELLFTIPRAVEERCSALFKERELSFSVIGHTNSSGQNEIVLDGITVPLPGTAWNQQYGDLIEQVVRRP
jgi:thiamine monophosphate kinase